MATYQLQINGKAFNTDVMRRDAGVGLRQQPEPAKPIT